MSRQRKRGRWRFKAPVAVGLLTLAVGATSAGAQRQRPGEIRSITLEPLEGATLIELVADPPIRWSALAASGDRLIVDLQNLRPSREVAQIELAGGVVSGIEVVAQGGRRKGASTRLEITTLSRVAYTVEAEAERLRIELRERQPDAPEAGGDPAVSTATVTTPPSQPRAGADYDDTVYLISPGDVLNIDVMGTDELDRSVRVLADGRIALPLLGRFPIAGLTVEGAEQRIGSLLRERQLLKQPEVLVLVEESAAASVSVQGGVRSPGQYSLVGTVTLLEVLGMAGGLAEQTPGQKIYVMRKSGNQELRITVDADRLLAEADMSENLGVRPGDIIMVPRSAQARVFVSGEVARPGPVPFTAGEGITVLQAITAAGGLTNRAKQSKIFIIRRQPDGSQSTIVVNLKRIRKGQDLDVPLEANDTVSVQTSFL